MAKGFVIVGESEKRRLPCTGTGATPGCETTEQVNVPVYAPGKQPFVGSVGKPPESGARASGGTLVGELLGGGGGKCAPPAPLGGGFGMVRLPPVPGSEPPAPLSSI
jgi:hypothetical protein